MTMSKTSTKPSLKAAQCSRSMDCRAFSAPSGDEASVRAHGEHLVDGLEVVQAGREHERQRRADEQVLDVAGQLLVEPAHLVGVEHRAVLRLEDSGGAGVDDDETAVAEVAPEAPAVDLGVPVGPAREVEDGLGQVELTPLGSASPDAPDAASSTRA